MNEYSDLVRISEVTTMPPGYAFLSESAAPLIVGQLTSDFTFAHGRILYEVFDDWNERVIGYIAPSTLVELASQYKDGVSTDRFKKVPAHQQKVAMHAYQLVRNRFPRIPAIAAIRFAEKAERRRWNGQKRSLEEIAVDYVKHDWTSFDFRLEIEASTSSIIQAGHFRMNRYNLGLESRKQRVLESVKPRVRDVLRSWLPDDLSFPDMITFWKRHGLFDRVDGQAECWTDKVLFESTGLTNYGGLETVANLASRSKIFT